MAGKIAIVKKLSAKVLVGNVKTYIKDLQPGQSVDLFRVVGIANKTKTGTSNYGDWEALLGNFIAEALVGAKKDQRYRTGQLFLPDVVLNMVTPLIDGKSAVQMGFVVSAIADDDSNTGYIYSADFLMEPEENDPLEALMKKALPAPAEKNDEKGEKDKK